MDAIRRSVLKLVAGAPLVHLVTAHWPRRATASPPPIAARRATKADAAALATIFNEHLALAACPYADRIAAWTSQTAEEFIEVHNGTILVLRDKTPVATPVAFGSLIDYADPKTISTLADGAEPEVAVVAISPAHLAPDEMRTAATHLAAAMARELDRMGFTHCRMRFPADGWFGSEDWLERHMVVRRIRTVNGVAQAREVTFDVQTGLAALRAEGF